MKCSHSDWFILLLNGEAAVERNGLYFEPELPVSAVLATSVVRPLVL